MNLKKLGRLYATNDPSDCHVPSYSHDQFRYPNALYYHFIADYTFVWCDYCKSPDHDINGCPYHINDARCANHEKMMNDITKND